MQLESLNVRLILSQYTTIKVINSLAFSSFWLFPQYSLYAIVFITTLIPFIKISIYDKILCRETQYIKYDKNKLISAFSFIYSVFPLVPVFFSLIDSNQSLYESMQLHHWK